MIGMRRYGLGDIIPLPSYEVCQPWDGACVQRNQDKSTQYGLDLERAQGSNNYTQCVANAGNSVGAQQLADSMSRCNAQLVTQTPDLQVSGSSGAGPGGGSKVGSFIFTTSRGTMTLFPGDTWNITITGATPNVNVTTYGSMKGVAYGQSGDTGKTDGNGNWSKSGTVSAGDVGVWQENWSVGGVKVGEANFTVLPPSIIPVVAQSQTPVNPTVVQQEVNTTNGTPQGTVYGLFGDTSPELISDVPVHEYTLLGLVGVVVVGIMLMSGGRKGRF